MIQFKEATRKIVAMSLAVAVLTTLPVAGIIGGGYATFEWTKPTEPVCGLFVLPQLIIVGFGIAGGFALGLGIAWFTTLGILKWVNRSGLSDLPDDEYLVM